MLRFRFLASITFFKIAHYFKSNSCSNTDNLQPSISFLAPRLDARDQLIVPFFCGVIGAFHCIWGEQWISKDLKVDLVRGLINWTEIRMINIFCNEMDFTFMNVPSMTSTRCVFILSMGSDQDTTLAMWYFAKPLHESPAHVYYVKLGWNTFE